MASSADATEVEDEMSSLFEGMDLFIPTQITDNQTLPNPNHHQDPPPPPSPSPSSSSSSLATAAAATAPETSSSSAPLDENLFSDLTLVTPNDISQTLIPQSDPPNTTSNPSVDVVSSTDTPTISRSVSRRKKKAAIKIGYGRDTSFTDEPPVSIPVPTTTAEPKSPPPRDSDSSNSVEPKSSIAANGDSEAPLQPPIEVGIGGSEEKTSSKEEALVTEDESAEPTGTRSDHSPTSVSTQEVDSGSIEEKLTRIRSGIEEKIGRIRVMVGSASGARKESAKKRRKAAENVNLSSVKYKQLEKELEEACEAEDFERADELSESLAVVEKEKEDYFIALRDAEADCDSDDLKMQEVLEMLIAAEEEGVTLLEQFAEDAANSADLVLKDAEEFSSKETNEWLSSVETLEMKKMELEIESQLINDARLGLNESIEQLIEDDKRQKELLCKKREVLAEELENLLALVRQKELEIAENDCTISEVDKKIADAVSGFNEAQSSIDLKHHNVQSVLSKIELESDALSVKKKELDDHYSQEEKRGAKLGELVNGSLAEAKACRELVALRKSLAVPLLKSREDKARLGKSEEKILEEIQMLRQEVASARTSLQELSSTRSNIQQEIVSSKQRVLFIDKRSPELEAQKKVTAAARNFKEAARLAAEVKTLTVEKESIQNKVDTAILELEKIEKEISDTVNRLQESEELILSKEKEAAMAGCERLHLVAAAAMAERSAAIELGDHDEANALTAEAEAAKSQAAKLQEAYNLEVEFKSIAEDLISMELIANLGGSQLAKMAASVSFSTS